MAQRLIRKVCKRCGAERPPTTDEIALLQEASGDDPQKNLTVGSGCDACRQSGYRGRLGIFELLTVDDAVRDKIQSRANVTEIRESAVSAGMRLLREDGLRKIAAGVTTPAEVQRVAMRAAM